MKIFKDEATLGVAIVESWREKKRLLSSWKYECVGGELSIFSIVCEQFLYWYLVHGTCCWRMMSRLWDVGCGILGWSNRSDEKRKTAKTKFSGQTGRKKLSKTKTRFFRLSFFFRRVFVFRFCPTDWTDLDQTPAQRRTFLERKLSQLLPTNEVLCDFMSSVEAGSDNSLYYRDSVWRLQIIVTGI